MFANALGYEDLMGRWSVRLGAMFLDFARIHGALSVLDVGCGTGSLVLNILDKMPKCDIFTQTERRIAEVKIAERGKF